MVIKTGHLQNLRWLSSLRGSLRNVGSSPQFFRAITGLSPFLQNPGLLQWPQVGHLPGNGSKRLTRVTEMSRPALDHELQSLRARRNVSCVQSHHSRYKCRNRSREMKWPQSEDFRYYGICCWETYLSRNHCSFCLEPLLSHSSNWGFLTLLSGRLGNLMGWCHDIGTHLNDKLERNAAARSVALW